jgi:glucose-6-phosphate isomerase
MDRDSGFGIRDSSVLAASLRDAIRSFEALLRRDRFVARLWERDASLWSQDPAVQATIRNRLGWLDAIGWTLDRLTAIREFAASVRDEGFRRVLLLGMGGSSLAPEVLNRVLGPRSGWPRFVMLDSTDPAAVRDADHDLERTLFILASKSGTTIESNSLAAYFARRLEDSGISPAADRFIAITDPKTVLHERASRDRFRHVFLNPPDIGGRFSALSLFGMVPAALMGLDVERLLNVGLAMADACKQEDVARNPGVSLGVLMAAGAGAGRDKLSLAMPPPIESFGLWVEQLVAESTGKDGKGLVPIVNERLSAPDQAMDRMRVTLEIATPEALGAEFMRWEIGTATAGALMGVNPFDEPNVREAKDATGALLGAYKQDRRLPARTPDVVDPAGDLTLSDAARASLGATRAWRFLDLLRPPDYLGLLVYLAPSATIDDVSARARHRVTEITGCAAMVGYGPRYLHSTGQLHKGGPNTGAFVIVTATPASDLEVPGEGFSFGVLEQAQALGDFLALERTGRRVLHAHLPDASVEALRALLDRLLHGLRASRDERRP